MAPFLSTHDVAESLGVPPWRICRLFEDGNLPDPPRIGGKRVIARSDIPNIIEALRARGWWLAAVTVPEAVTT